MLSEEVARFSLLETTAPLVLVGHSHVALALGWDGETIEGGLAPAGTEAELPARRWLLNPGSVGQPRDGDARAAWLLIDDEAGRGTFRRVTYPIDKTQAEIRERGLPDGARRPDRARRLDKGLNQMAELTNLESKLGEVVGLAMAAQEAGQKVAKLAQEDGNNELVGTLERMRGEAKETEERGTEVAGSFDGKKTAILDEAREVKQKAQEMMKTYLDQASDSLDGFEFLTMAEAGEVGHWEILGTLNKRAAKSEVSELVSWALPIQQRHLETVRKASLELASEEDPNETSS